MMVDKWKDKTLVELNSLPFDECLECVEFYYNRMLVNQRSGLWNNAVCLLNVKGIMSLLFTKLDLTTYTPKNPPSVESAGKWQLLFEKIHLEKSRLESDRKEEMGARDNFGNEIDSDGNLKLAKGCYWLFSDTNAGSIHNRQTQIGKELFEALPEKIKEFIWVRDAFKDWFLFKYEDYPFISLVSNKNNNNTWDCYLTNVPIDSPDIQKLFDDFVESEELDNADEWGNWAIPRHQVVFSSKDYREVLRWDEQELDLNYDLSCTLSSHIEEKDRDEFDSWLKQNYLKYDFISVIARDYNWGFLTTNKTFDSEEWQQVYRDYLEERFFGKQLK